MRRRLAPVALVLATCLAACAHRGAPAVDAFAMTPPPHGKLSTPTHEQIAASLPPPPAPAPPAPSPPPAPAPITAEERATWPQLGDSVHVDVPAEAVYKATPAYPDSARE